MTTSSPTATRSLRAALVALSLLATVPASAQSVPAADEAPLRAVMAALNAVPRLPAVAFTVRGVVPDGGDAALVALAGAPGLQSLRGETAAGGGTSVEARFTFGTVAAWAAWRASAETGALLAPLSGGPLGLQTTLDVSRVGARRD